MVMKIKMLSLILSIVLLTSCKTPNYLPKQYKIGEVEYFDIENFEKKKDKESNEYFFMIEDTIQIIQGIDKNDSNFTYFERIINYPKNYVIYKNFYSNGIIKYRERYYHYNYMDFKIGKWEYFDEQGNLLKVKDMDGKDRYYNMTYKEAFRKVWWHFGFSKKGVHIRVMPGKDRLFWVFSKAGKKSKAVDMNTGKVSNASITQGNDVYRGDDKD